MDSIPKYFPLRRWSGRGARRASHRSASTSLLICARTSFARRNVESRVALPPGQQRWTVDHPADLEFVRKIYEAFSQNGDFGFREVLDLLKERPDLATIQVETITNEGYYKSLYQQAKTEPGAKAPLAQSQAWLERSRKVIPGCAQTFSKGYTQYVQGVAPIFLRARQRLPRVGRGRQRVHRLRAGTAAQHSRLRARGGERGRGGAACPRGTAFRCRIRSKCNWRSG